MYSCDFRIFFRNVTLVFDEMKIQEGLVFDKENGSIVGFVDTGDMNAKLKSFEAQVTSKEVQEKEVATHMLALYVRGIFLKLEYPIAQFPYMLAFMYMSYSFIAHIVQYNGSYFIQWNL